MAVGTFYQGKRVLLLGATGGLGSELARQLAARGAGRLVLSGRNEAALAALADEVRAAGTAADVLPCDVRDRDALARCLERALEGGLDGAFLACGVAPGKSADGLEEPEEMARCFAVNVLAPASALVLLCRGWERAGRGRRFAAVVTSQAGLLPLPFAPAYAASKAAMNALGEGLRDRLAAAGAALTLVMPGFFDSPMGRRFRGKRKWFSLSAEEAARRTLDGTARGEARCIFPWELACGIWLANHLPAWIVKPVMQAFAFDTAPDGESAARGREDGRR